MKVYCIYEGKDVNGGVVDNALAEPYKLKIDIPTKWLDGPCERLLQFVVATYNSKKSPERKLAAEGLVMRRGDVELKPTDIIEQRVAQYNDIYICHMAKTAQEASSGQKGGRVEGLLICTNYGCGKSFLPEENNETACYHHREPPIFRDIEKYWRCCPTKRARDWEEFQAIPTCCHGPHSTANAPVSFKSSPVSNVPLNTVQIQAVEAVSGPSAVGCRVAGPREFEGAKDAGKENKPQEIVDGKARCRNFGCQKEFVVSENNETACQYHSSGPVFWDTYRYWKCCPQKKCYDFENFMKVPGCTVGPHLL
ncbi:putative CHORD [Trypanosoma vivax]|nr:putative CHORD [Trypanosoma vivax]